MRQKLAVGAGTFARGVRQGDNENTFTVPGYATVDAFASYSINFERGRLVPQVNITNLLDKRYFVNTNVSTRTRGWESCRGSRSLSQARSGGSTDMSAGLTSVSESQAAQSRRLGWPSYGTVWRWHFYAGLFSIPFVLWLSITGSIYLFRQQIEAWLDRPYDSLEWKGPRASAEDQVRTAIHTIAGSTLHFYELPRTDHAAVQVVVGRGTQEFRVYVHP